MRHEHRVPVDLSQKITSAYEVMTNTGRKEDNQLSGRCAPTPARLTCRFSNNQQCGRPIGSALINRFHLFKTSRHEYLIHGSRRMVGKNTALVFLAFLFQKD